MIRPIIAVAALPVAALWGMVSLISQRHDANNIAAARAAIENRHDITAAGQYLKQVHNTSSKEFHFVSEEIIQARDDLWLMRGYSFLGKQTPVATFAAQSAFSHISDSSTNQHLKAKEKEVNDAVNAYRLEYSDAAISLFEKQAQQAVLAADTARARETSPAVSSQQLSLR